MSAFRICMVLGIGLGCAIAPWQVGFGQTVTLDVPYVDSGHELQRLDIYAPAEARGRPVVFWIHGGGWQTGDKSQVALKPKAWNDRGFVFVSTNYRLLPAVDMSELIEDVATSIGWVVRNIGGYGGDPNRILVMGHSAGAQLAALLCIDERYLSSVHVPLTVVRGCVPVDGDTYDLPAIIATAELRQTLHRLPLPEFGHRVKFGNDPKKHIEYSAVTHVAKGKGIPPFLILYVAGHPDVTAQAHRLHNALIHAEIASTLFGASETTHSKLNDMLGSPDDAATAEIDRFIERLKLEEQVGVVRATAPQ